MSLVWGGVGTITAISGLALKVYKAYKGAPDDYKHITEDVKSLQIIINKAARYFKSTTLGDNDRQEGLDVLKSCQSVLWDLNSFIEKYNSLASANACQIFQRVKLGTEDIATLRARLAINATLLSSFIQSCEYLEIQARLADVLDLHRPKAISIRSITSFAGSANTKEAYQELCKDLYEIGVTAEVIGQKKREILNTFKSQSTATSGQVDDSKNITSPSQSPALNGNWPRFSWIRQRDPFGPVILAAAEAGHKRSLIFALESIKNIDFKDDVKETALHKAAENGHQDIVQLLLDKGASIEVKNKHKNTPLHLAAWGNHTNIMKLLLEKGASVQAMNMMNNTPLHLTAQKGHIHGAELLLWKNASIEAKNDAKHTPLYFAASNGHTNMVKLLLKKGASIEAKGRYNSTPLHRAARYGHVDMVELLLRKGALIEVVDTYNNTALHFAVRYGHTDTVKLLLEKGAPIEVRNGVNDTPLDDAVKRGHTKIVQLLKNKAAKLAAHRNR